MTMAMPESRYFLPYQQEAILDAARLVLWEKSIRIGATFGMAFRAVRRRVLGEGDCLVSSVNLPAAGEFIEQCRKFNDIFKVAASGVEGVSWGDNLSEKGFSITYPNGGRIFAFSSNPKSVRSFGGEVMLDEVAYHEHMVEMLKAAGGRAMWGYPVSIWSSHNGWDSEFNQLILRERAKGAKSRWRIRSTTLPEAIAAGLLDKINATRGLDMTRDQFVDETRDMVGGDEAYAEECLCQPRRGGKSAFPWALLTAAKKDYILSRVHVEGDSADELDRAGGLLADVLRDCKRPAIGYDVARTGHLSSISGLETAGNRTRLAALVTMHKSKFGSQRRVIETAMSDVRTTVGGGDSTGLGMQVCEELRDRFGAARWAGLNFGALKPDIGTSGIRAFEDGAFDLPADPDHADVVLDFAGIHQDTLPSGRVRFYETSNPANKLSHCDIAWSALIGHYAAIEQTQGCGVY